MDALKWVKQKETINTIINIRTFITGGLVFTFFFLILDGFLNGYIKF